MCALLHIGFGAACSLQCPPAVAGSLSSSCKDTSHTGPGPTLMTSSELGHLQRPWFHRSCHKNQGFRNQRIFGGHTTPYQELSRNSCFTKENGFPFPPPAPPPKSTSHALGPQPLSPPHTWHPPVMSSGEHTQGSSSPSPLRPASPIPDWPPLPPSPPPPEATLPSLGGRLTGLRSSPPVPLDRQGIP